MSAPLRGPSAARARGFALLEFSLASLLAVLLAVALAAKLGREAQDAAAQASGTWMAQVLSAVRASAVRDQADWERGEVPLDAAGKPRYADPARPSLEELVRSGSLPRGFPSRAPLGFSVEILVRGVACPGPACRLDAVVASAQPVRGRSGRALDLVAVMPLLERLAGQGAWLEPETSRLLGRVAGEAALAGIEAGRWQGGTVLAWTGQAGPEAPRDPRYVWVGDVRDPALRGQLSLAGSILARGDIEALREVRAGSYLSVYALRTLGAPCQTPVGALASDGNAELLACRGGVWQRAVRDRLGGSFLVSNRICVGGFDILASPPGPFATQHCACPDRHVPYLVSHSEHSQGYICVFKD